MDPISQIKEWLNDEIENRTLFIATLKEGAGDAGLLAEKEALLELFKGASAAASKSAAELEAFLAAHAANSHSASITKMWAGLK